MFLKLSYNENMQQIQNEIEKIKERNRRVEADKAWEVSVSRKILIAIFTYIVIVIFFIFAKLPAPFINAIVPAAAFILSTLSLPLFKKWWIKYVYKNQ